MIGSCRFRPNCNIRSTQTPLPFCPPKRSKISSVGKFQTRFPPFLRTGHASFTKIECMYLVRASVAVNTIRTQWYPANRNILSRNMEPRNVRDKRHVSPYVTSRFPQAKIGILQAGPELSVFLLAGYHCTVDCTNVHGMYLHHKLPFDNNVTDRDPTTKTMHSCIQYICSLHCILDCRM